MQHIPSVRETLEATCATLRSSSVQRQSVANTVWCQNWRAPSAHTAVPPSRRNELKKYAPHLLDEDDSAKSPEQPPSAEAILGTCEELMGQLPSLSPLQSFFKALCAKMPPAQAEDQRDGLQLSNLAAWKESKKEVDKAVKKVQKAEHDLVQATSRVSKAELELKEAQEFRQKIQADLATAESERKAAQDAHSKITQPAPEDFFKKAKEKDKSKDDTPAEMDVDVGAGLGAQPPDNTPLDHVATHLARYIFSQSKGTTSEGAGALLTFPEPVPPQETKGADDQNLSFRIPVPFDDTESDDEKAVAFSSAQLQELRRVQQRLEETKRSLNEQVEKTEAIQRKRLKISEVDPAKAHQEIEARAKAAMEKFKDQIVAGGHASSSTAPGRC